MSSEPNEVVAVNLKQGYSMLADGTMVPWEHMFDRDGDETSDPAEAVSAVHQLSDDSWITLDLSEWETVTLH